MPIELTMRAAAPGISAFSLWFVTIALLATAVYGILKPGGWIPEQSLTGWFQAGMLLLTLCFVLSRPSALGFPGWKASDHQAAKERCDILNSIREADITAIRYFIDHAIVRTRQRAVLLWWMTGAAWALSIYIAQKGWETRDGSLLGFALLPAFVVTLCAGMIAAYVRSIDHVHGLAHAILFDRQAHLSRLNHLREARPHLRSHRSQR